MIKVLPFQHLAVTVYVIHSLVNLYATASYD
jgi:hypothetical protein